MFAEKIAPDADELISVLLRERAPRRLHYIEVFLDPEIKQEICRRFDLMEGIGRSEPFYDLRLDVRLHAFLGYDVFRVRLLPKFLFDHGRNAAGDTASPAQNRGERSWMQEHHGPIQCWADFERYPWPKTSDIDLSELEWLEKNAPQGMGCYDLTALVLETVTSLLGYETLCYKMQDEPDLVDAICSRIGEFYVAFSRMLCTFDCVRLIWGADDMGFRTSTMVSPQFLREKILPWHTACADIAHESGRPYILHSCGCLDEVMDDLIDTVGIDGKHSFEDNILPVTEAFRRYGNRTAILGGIDVDFLCRAEETLIRKRVRDTLELCFMQSPGNGYCLGTGNSVANYIPVQSYLAMLDEGRRFS
jgi:uroporphyrinogen decarboxylase